jgi:hypothetical protein
MAKGTVCFLNERHDAVYVMVDHITAIEPHKQEGKTIISVSNRKKALVVSCETWMVRRIVEEKINPQPRQPPYRELLAEATELIEMVKPELSVSNWRRAKLFLEKLKRYGM